MRKNNNRHFRVTRTPPTTQPNAIAACELNGCDGQAERLWIPRPWFGETEPAIRNEKRTADRQNDEQNDENDQQNRKYEPTEPTYYSHTIHSSTT